MRQEPNHARAHYLLFLIYSGDPRTSDPAARHGRMFLRLAPGDSASSAVKQWLAEAG